MAGKNAIHNEIQKMFNNLQAKPLERDLKILYGIRGDIHEIGTEKAELSWYQKMRRKLDDIKTNEAIIYRGVSENVFIRKTDLDLWIVARIGLELRVSSHDDSFITDTDHLLNILHKIRY